MNHVESCGKAIREGNFLEPTDLFGARNPEIGPVMFQMDKSYANRSEAEMRVCLSVESYSLLALSFGIWYFRKV